MPRQRTQHDISVSGAGTTDNIMMETLVSAYDRNRLVHPKEDEFRSITHDLTMFINAANDTDVRRYRIHLQYCFHKLWQAQRATQATAQK